MTRAIVLDFFNAMDANGVRGTVPFLSDNFVWWVAGAGEIQDKLLAIDDLMAPHLASPLRIIVHDIIVEGNKAAVEASANATLDNGLIYNNLYHFKIWVKSGKISEIKEYNDTMHATEIWGALLN